MAERHCDVIYGHEDAVRCLGYSPDGTLLISGGSDAKVRFWNLKKRRCVEEFSEFKSSILSVGFSPDGHSWAAMDREGNVRIFNIDGSQTHCKVHPTGGFCWSPDSRHIIGSNNTGRVFLYGLQNKQPLYIQRHTDQEVLSLAVSPDGRYVASAASDCLIRIWDTLEAKEIPSLEFHKNSIKALAFSPDSKYLGSGDGGALLAYWSIGNNPPLKAPTQHFQWSGHEITDVAYCPCYTIFAASATDNRIKLFDFDNNNKRLEDLGSTGHGHSRQINAIAFSPCGKFLASAGSDHKIIVWPVKKPTYVS